MFLFKYFMAFKGIDHCPRNKYWENCMYHRQSFLWNFWSGNNRLKNSPQTGWNSSSHSECFWPALSSKAPWNIDSVFHRDATNSTDFLRASYFVFWEGNQGWNELSANWNRRIDPLLLRSCYSPYAWTISPHPKENKLQRKMCRKKGDLNMIPIINTQTCLEDCISFHLQQWMFYLWNPKWELGIRHWRSLKRKHTFPLNRILSPLRTKKELS